MPAVAISFVLIALAVAVFMWFPLGPHGDSSQQNVETWEDLKVLHILAMAYTQDHQGKLPPMKSEEDWKWLSLVQGELSLMRRRHSRSITERLRTYRANHTLSGKHLGEANPSETLFKALPSEAGIVWGIRVDGSLFVAERGEENE